MDVDAQAPTLTVKTAASEISEVLDTGVTDQGTCFLLIPSFLFFFFFLVFVFVFVFLFLFFLFFVVVVVNILFVCIKTPNIRLKLVHGYSKWCYSLYVRT